jgi:hypothetical protein|tara:strand:- start:8212 stop:8595 length:384 start_codon:yes stop_codon:yes gene_type:complete
MICWSSFSQTDTEKDSTKTIQLSNPIAKLVVKDLIKGDNSTKEINALVKLISVTNDKLVTQSDLVSNLKSQTFTLNNIITQKDSQIKTAAEMSDDLQSALKKANRQKKLYQIGSAIGGGAILLLLIQ